MFSHGPSRYLKMLRHIAIKSTIFIYLNERWLQEFGASASNAGDFGCARRMLSGWLSYTAPRSNCKICAFVSGANVYEMCVHREVGYLRFVE